MPSKQRNASAEIAWIADTGSAQDLVCSKMIPNDLIYHSNEPLELITANGSQSADQQASIHIVCINKEVHPYVLPDTPAVISVGMRCIQDGWDFVWRKFSRPYFRKKDGSKIKLEVKDYVPYLPSKDGRIPAALGVPFSWTSAAGNGEPSMIPRRASRMSAVGFESDDDELYEPSIANTEDLEGAREDIEEFFPGELAPGPPAAMTPDIVDGTDSDVELPEEVDERLQLPEPKPIDRGEAALREEARTLRHMMTHTPKNPFCETCKCSKMYKPTKRHKGESLTVESTKFGDHITGDHLITGDVNEESIDGDRVALIMKDIATNFRWVYPSARSHAKDCVLAFRHFIAPGEEVANSIRLACREVGWRQNTSVAYVSKSNAVAERNLRSVLEGTRVNLILTGVMLHDIGVWHTTYKTTLKSNHPGNLGSGKSSRDPIFLLGLALIIGLDPNSNQRKIFVLIRLPIPVCFLVMPFNQVSFGEMNFMWHHLRILWRKTSMKLFKSFVSTNLLFLMDRSLFL